MLELNGCSWLPGIIINKVAIGCFRDTPAVPVGKDEQLLWVAF